MNEVKLYLGSAVLMGLGATLVFDLWSLVLRYGFGIAPSSICLIGRWLRYLPDGIYMHASIAAAPPRSKECLAGWLAHYTIGVLFAAGFIILAGKAWLEAPTPAPAILFGVVTVLAPFLILQPLFGLGVAAGRAPNPAQARLRSLTNHIAFGAGLYLFGVLANGLLRALG